MTIQELRDMNEFNRKSLNRENEVRNWALELGWRFDTKMTYLNYYIPNTNYRYDPTYSDWKDENKEICDCIFAQETLNWSEVILYKGIIKDKADLESKMKEFGIPITRLENTGVVNQIRLGKEQGLTPDECRELGGITLKDLL